MSALRSAPTPPSDSNLPIPEAPSTSTIDLVSMSPSRHSVDPSTVNGRPAAMPSHWENRYPEIWPCLRPVFYYTFRNLCLISVGCSDLERKWRVVYSNYDECEFQKETSRITTKVTTTNIVAGLLLASTAALITTQPPRADVIDYNTRGPYLCLLCSFGIMVGGIVVGCAILFVLSTASAQWTRDTIMATRLRIWIILTILAYPFLSIGVGTSVNFMGLLAAAWMSEDRLANLGGAALLAVPSSLMGLFALESRKHTEPDSHMRSDAEAGTIDECTTSTSHRPAYDRAPNTTPPLGRQTRAFTL